MMRTFVFIGSVALLAQSADTPRFEVADVHVSAHTPNPNARGGVLRGGRYELRTANMVDLIGVAYGVDADKVLGGPSWLESDRFDVIAKAPASTPPETVKLMLQSLLADRFKLVVHKETKPLPSYALTVGKGKPKLKEADGSGDTGSKFTLEPRPAPEAGGPVSPVLLYACHNVTMAAFGKGCVRWWAPSSTSAATRWWTRPGSRAPGISTSNTRCPCGFRRRSPLGPI